MTDKPPVNDVFVPYKMKEKKKKSKTVKNVNEEMVKQMKKTSKCVIDRKRNLQQKPSDIILENVNLIVASKELLVDCTLKLTRQRKYGLIGRNGIGKSCLMNALANQEFQNQPEHIQILLVEQEIEPNDQTPVQFVLEVDVERTELLQKIEQETDEDKMCEISDRLEEIDAYNTEGKARKILKGLGFTDKMLDEPTQNLSGGWRMRISLARALFVQSDILLLDEPTNHLDIEAVIWLENYINNSKQSIIIVSHDRSFLNNTTQETIHFYRQKLHYYKGNYDIFERERAKNISIQEKAYKTQQLEIDHLKHFIERFKANCARSKQAQSRVKVLNKLELVEQVMLDPQIHFNFPEPEELNPNVLITLQKGVYGYENSDNIFENLNFFCDTDSRIAIVGHNGQGKSTLLKLLTQQLQIQEGTIYSNPYMRSTIFSQHHSEHIDLKLSPIEYLNKEFPGNTYEKLRQHLSKFGLIDNLATHPMALLSGGQKSRVAFAVSVFKNPHLLILDEPTNHLDIDAINALIMALVNYKGGIVIVSHDQHLIESVCDEIYIIKDKQAIKFEGDFEDYKNSLVENMDLSQNSEESYYSQE